METFEVDQITAILHNDADTKRFQHENYSSCSLRPGYLRGVTEKESHVHRKTTSPRRSARPFPLL